MTGTHLLPVDVSQPARIAHRRRDIQGLRAIAVIMVVAYHAQLPMPGGFTGVDVFFVISGFVITSMLNREFEWRGRIRLATFYGRRFLRLTPALALLVACVAVASALLQSPFGAQQATAQTGIGAMLLSANLVIAHATGDYFATDAKFNPLLNTWSLSVEEQFYLVFPTLLIVGWWIGSRLRKPRVIAWVVLAVTLASFWLCLAWTEGGSQGSELTSWLGSPQSAAFYFSPARAWEFGVGALLAILMARPSRMPRSVARWSGFVGIGMIAISAFGITDAMAFPGTLALVPVLGTALVIMAGSHHRPMASRMLSIRPLVAIGNISYSWYLWHWPVIVFTALLLPSGQTVLVFAALASLIPATLSYIGVEQPLRRWRPRRPSTGFAMAFATLGIPIALCAALLAGAQAGWGVFDTRAIAASTGTGPESLDDPVAFDDPVGLDAPVGGADDPIATDSEQPLVDDRPAEGGEAATDPTRSDLRAAHVAVARGCVNTDFDPKRCSWGPRNPKGIVLVVGDSQAYAIADGAIEAATDLGYRTIVSSRTGCPFLARESTGGNELPCRPWQENIFDYATEAKPDVVMIANRSGGYVRPERQWRMIETASGGVPSTAGEARSSYAQALAETVRDLRSSGIGVVIVGAVPEMTGYIDQRSLLSGVLAAPPFTVTRKDSEDYRSPAFDAEQRLAARDPAVISFDPIPLLCEEATCATRVGDEILYQDETHLSVGGAMRLVSGLNSAIQAAASAAQTPASGRRSP